MTSASSFPQAYEAFRGLPYPAYPQTEEVQDWNSHLLTLDGWIAGYATRIANGSMSAAEVPEIPDLIRRVEDLLRDLARLTSRVEAEEQLLKQYRSYVAALHRLITEISALADKGIA
ncbi:hypothetical protein [Streptomyces sp. NPDC046988]|uniref:hypothetical protein n=1 Tax=Streptomyces sp. NPDC046988 TaxID=3154922 RepID=UPI0033C11026